MSTNLERFIAIYLLKLPYAKQRRRQQRSTPTSLYASYSAQDDALIAFVNSEQISHE